MRRRGLSGLSGSSHSAALAAHGPGCRQRESDRRAGAVSRCSRRDRDPSAGALGHVAASGFTMSAVSHIHDRSGSGVSAPPGGSGRMDLKTADTNMSVPPEGSAVLIFTRSPRREGQAKSRCHATGANARAIATALLGHTLHIAQAVGADVIVASDEHIAGVLPGRERVLVQRGRSFGRRLRNAVADTFALRYRRVVVIGNAGRAGRGRHANGCPRSRPRRRLLPALRLTERPNRPHRAILVGSNTIGATGDVESPEARRNAGR